MLRNSACSMKKRYPLPPGIRFGAVVRVSWGRGEIRLSAIIVSTSRTIGAAASTNVAIASRNIVSASDVAEGGTNWAKPKTAAINATPRLVTAQANTVMSP